MSNVLKYKLPNELTIILSGDHRALEFVEHKIAEINRLRLENERLRAALEKINVGEGWAAQIARAALAQPAQMEE